MFDFNRLTLATGVFGRSVAVRGIALGSLVGVALGAVLGAVPARAADGALLDGIVAVVNEGVVLQSELEEQTAMITERLREQDLQLPPEEVLENQILERLIVTRIQLQRAERLGIRISDEMLNNALTEVAARNGISFSELPEALAAQGIPYGAYREDMRDQLTLEQLRQIDVVSRISVSPREIEQCLERQENTLGANTDFDISHILIGVPASATAEQFETARKKAQEVYEEIRAGADFSRAAVTYSDGQNALEGGALGWRNGEQLPTLFTDVVIDMAPGDVSEPIRSASGFHIIRLNDMRGAMSRSEVEQTRVRHILMQPNEILDDATVEQRLWETRERILAGERFEDLAELTSDDPGSAAEGGDLGWSNPGSFVPEFEQVMSALEEGELSEPFRTRYGWHLLEVTDRRVYDNTEEVKRRNCVRAIRDARLGEETELWLRRLRDEAYVEKRI